MVKLRKGISYSKKLERPYTRYSKYKALNYVRSRPVCKIPRFDTGDPKRTYEYTCSLIAKSDVQIRDSSIESARQTSNRLLEKTLGKSGYSFKVRIYPHHILRENPLASGAGADRLSTGMAHSFGKNIGIAARVYKGSPLFTVQVDKPNLPLARQALKRASYKLPCGCSIVVAENKPAQKVAPVPVAEAAQ